MEIKNASMAVIVVAIGPISSENPDNRSEVRRRTPVARKCRSNSASAQSTTPPTLTAKNTIDASYKILQQGLKLKLARAERRDFHGF